MFERIALVPRLPTIRAILALRQVRLGGIFLESVTAWRLVAIVAVHPQTTAQLGILCFELRIFSPKPLNQRF
jgi:hypothetical protein